MEQKRNWTGWLLIAVIIVVSGGVLAASALSDPQPEASAVPMATPQTTTPAAAQSPSAMVVSQKRTANASAIGYVGPVLVRLTLDEKDAIEALDIGGARFQETEGLGSKVKDANFTQGFLGKTPPLELGKDVDAIAGATFSSRAAVEAVNEAAAFLSESAASDTN